MNLVLFSRVIQKFNKSSDLYRRDFIQFKTKETDVSDYVQQGRLRYVLFPVQEGGKE